MYKQVSTDLGPWLQGCDKKFGTHTAAHISDPVKDGDRIYIRPRTS